MANPSTQIPNSSSSANTTRRSRSIHPDLESGSSPVCCRICLENGSTEGDELIAPCLCRGSQEFVHRTCLDRWRSVKEGFAFSHCSTCKAAFGLQVKEVKYDIVTRINHKLFVVKDFFLHFLIVQALIVVLGGYSYMVDYKGMIIHNPADKYFSFLSSQPPISFYYSMGALVFLIGLGCYFFIKGCIWLVNLDQRIAGCQNFLLAILMCNCLPATIVIILIVVTIYVFVFCGIGYGLFLVTTFVHKSWHRHYQILLKRNLTKVYVVVDQRGHYIPPTLDPRHEQHLRSLNLL